MSAKNQAGALFNGGKYAEAIPLYREVVEIDASDLSAWEHLVCSLRNTQAYEAGVETSKTALKLHARSAWLWRELGQMLIKLDRLDEANRTLDQARRIEPETEWLWRYYADLYRKQKNYSEEATALEELIRLEMATSSDLNLIGIAYRKGNNYGRALSFYRMSARMEADSATYFNLGLLFNDSEVSQDADATDAYRRALQINPTYAKAQKQLSLTTSKLIPLAKQALEIAKYVIHLGERYQYYLNPFEALQIDAETDQLDVKVIQKSKKKLLQELDLNDGRVSWLEDQPLDRSRVLVIADELDDVVRRNYHRLIYRNEPLLRFLTHGDIRHFLYSDDYFPEELLHLLEEDDGFRAFLSIPFATQYNVLLSQAIESNALTVVEVLFDGRRWVEDADIDLCLSGAFKRVGKLVDILTSLESQSEARLVGFPEIQNALNVHHIVELFNLLPTQFRAQQTQVVACLRSLAINSHNKHGQTEMSKNILLLCKEFQFKSHSLNEKLKEDYAKIEEIISEQRSPLVVLPQTAQPSKVRSASQATDKPAEAKNRGYNPNMCFFCKRKEAKKSMQLSQPIYRVISRYHRTVQFSRAEIGIERCASCKAIHMKASGTFWIVAILTVGICCLLSLVEDGFFVVAIILAISFAALKGSILAYIIAGKGTRAQTNRVISEHPVLKEGIAQGWSLHKPG